MDLSEEYQPLNLEIIKPVTKSFCESTDFFTDEPRTILSLDPGSNYSTYYMLNNSTVQSVIVRPASPVMNMNPDYADWVKLSYPNCYPQYVNYPSPPRVSMSTYHQSDEPRDQLGDCQRTMPRTVDHSDGDWRGRAVQMESGMVTFWVQLDFVHRKPFIFSP